ncbi:class I SAM-dependent methyltransferase [Epibacterium ulvae]|uniref:class I SAM-dependent methyltransferase n=1 Tax=Epibacterium ulvae TaxID=1156985 RepID=UPI001BFC7F6E|nr:class I SAM-dependent methyltransferase [Epibacterium ulvae]
MGSYEGASACYLIDANKWHDELEMFCVDTWEGGAEHQSNGVNMRSVEERFVSLACSQAAKGASVTKLKGTSDLALSKLLNEGHASSFDFIYVVGIQALQSGRGYRF